MEKNKIALVGFRATGKSLIGKRLAESLGWSFVDMDDRLVESFGETIQSWVSRHGWDAFRDREAELLARLGEGERLVVATGGGAVLRPTNRKTLTEHFHVVWLRARKSTILARLSQDPRTAEYRPPLTGLSREAEIETLLAERKPLYETVADLVLDTDDKRPDELVANLMMGLRGSADKATC
ncbi:MAG: shikimate kinase [Syntrophobacteraceae bacterium]